MAADAIAVRRGGLYHRLAEPYWDDPIATGCARAAGGRWNPPGRFGALYLNDSVELARAQADHKLRGQPFGVEDLEPSRQHVLVPVTVGACEVRDCASEAGLLAVGLPASYPADERGGSVGHERCQRIAAAAHAAGLDGVGCRSAAAGAAGREELALFEEAASRLARADEAIAFAEWYLEQPAGSA